MAGTSPTWIKKALQALEARHIHGVLINYDPSAPSRGHSVVRRDYVNAMQCLTGYFYQHDKCRIALMGMNSNSSADWIKAHFFATVKRSEGDATPQHHIFYNHQIIQKAIDGFLPQPSTYNGIICANDLVAITLPRRLHQSGSDSPRKLFVARFGESVLSQWSRPSITPATLDHEAM